MAWHDWMVMPTTRNHIQRPDGHRVLTNIRGIVEVLRRLELGLAESQTIGIEHMIGIIVYLDVTITIILQTRRAQCAREEDFLKDEVIVLSREIGLNRDFLGLACYLHILCLTCQDTFTFCFLALRVLGCIYDIGRIDAVVKSLQ